ncbi:GNAT family N-acetyltransferase [Streptomyces sp. NBC_01217]|uniref:GNAT family N-acetyltransferase n=1 Tax=Streptomyces sp. NBC_01217 TaxID=2903779 RepID=UPI002E0DE363|nr:GNAT family N-acetyltransferase [Streptomyces sp. NBC_01217]WSQ62549.1 GNAT family N-acetyltransferase [Streptomyces sp. NBC_01217]
MSLSVPLDGSGRLLPAHTLDNVAWAALTGPHAAFAQRRGSAARYAREVSPFAALADPDDPGAWEDLAGLFESGEETFLPGITHAPAGWTVSKAIPGVEMVGASVRAETDPEAVRLGPADVPDMLDLVARAQPGPFREKTVTLGAYFGFRWEGRLVAMAGERLHAPGWTEISAVCTDPDFRGQGLAGRLVRTVAAHIHERGDTSYLQAAAANCAAIRLYESLGFALRRHTQLTAVRAP